MKAGEERELSLQQDLEATRALAAKVPHLRGYRRYTLRQFLQILRFPRYFRNHVPVLRQFDGPVIRAND